MSDYTDLLPEIIPHVASCPIPSVIQAVQRIAQDYFQRSEAYTHDIGTAAVTSNATNVTVNLPTDTKLVVPLTLYLNSARLATTNHNMLSLEFADWKNHAAETPKFVMIDDTVGNELVLALTPDQSYSLTGRVAVKPVRTATQIADIQMENHGDALVSGTLHRLMMMKNTEWYDPNLANYHMADYERAIDEAHDISNKGNTSRLMTTSYGG